MSNSLQTKVVIILLLIVACFGVGYFFTTPQWSAYSQAKSLLSHKQAEAEQLHQALSSMQTFVGQFNSHQQDLSRVNLALPVRAADLPNFLTSLSAMAQASGLALSNFTILENVTDKPAPANSIQTAHITISASGAFESFKDFMKRAETNLRLIDVDRISVKSDNDQIQYVITLRTYYQK